MEAVARPGLGSVARRPGSREPLYDTVVRAALLTSKAMRWEVAVSGEEHIPATGPAVIASNHVGYLDFVFLGMAAHPRGRLVRFMAMREAFDHWLGGPLLRGMKHIPVDRRGDPAPAFDQAVRALEAGEVLGIHPEGRINPSVARMPGKSGAARMALATGAPLIPAAVWGSQRLLAPRARRKFPRNVAISVRVGPPVEFEGSTTPGELTERLMDRIHDLWRGIRGPGRPADRLTG